MPWKVFLTFLLPVLLVAHVSSLAATQHTTLQQLPETMHTSVVSTGQTTGHFANLRLQNTGTEAIEVQIQRALIPATAKHGSFASMKQMTVRVGAGTTFEVPLTGYSLDVAAKPLPSGESYPQPSAWQMGERAGDVQLSIHTMESLYDGMPEESLKPYVLHPLEQREAVLQQAIWRMIADEQGMQVDQRVFRMGMQRHLRARLGKAMQRLSAAERRDWEQRFQVLWHDSELITGGIDSNVGGHS